MIIDRERIREVLPYGDAFLLVDGITEASGNTASGIVRDVGEWQIVKNLPEPSSLNYEYVLIDQSTVYPDNFVGIMHVEAHMHHFAGHFADKPLLPGVQNIEAAAESSRDLASLLLANKKGLRSTRLSRIVNWKLKRKIVPGEELIVVGSKSAVEKDLAVINARSMVDDEPASYGTLHFQPLELSDDYHPGKATIIPCHVVEAACQIGAYLILGHPDNHSKLLMLAEVNAAVFLESICPGQELQIRTKLLSRIRRNFGKAGFTVDNLGHTLAYGTFTFRLADKNT
ncbi:MAG: 3-hydroxyacyl-[acyl-carrier-protein] dehydratase FabZ [candidate division CPR2 bacterium GW2011_GWC1_41_48]|uniref:3-hydroxyacyl-[acyl-carrier-protein] dehydratase FabZ n=1 Tax=candidate division CPR2 bacterium GW2011_GWC1_41_48 TaxID=1618344 RepID=A0A0G0W6F0_UNCC2|nr:MAG: 3-hydroxyacyl-[acyl-carrier-protein] dehydratase FabZ [candidate division CPR2 bacterium GW2011_GWC2_39_35]KKS08530.1 MAG: 3-hydroxyacyl-[acyl-carrier-protein] dehydratase FabZ [candidate division CPR2 bacterium GW2011_GWC1_41_48]